MMDCGRILLPVIAGALLAGAVEAKAGAVGANVLPDEVVKPCRRPVQVEKLTRIVIPMTPYRGVNLIFPFELEDSRTIYSMSSNQPWTFGTASGTNIVDLSFNSYPEWGELSDFTVSVGGYVFSMTLKADPDITNHCTNIVFEFSDEQLKEIREGEKKEYLAALDAEYEKKLAELDKQAEREGLKLVGALSQGSPDDTGIHEYNVLKLSNGDEVELYISEMQGWGAFSVLTAEISNDSEVNSLYLKELEVGRVTDSGQKSKVKGYADLVPKLKPDSVKPATFTTLESLPSTGGYMVLTTDRGKVEVTW